MGVLFSILSGRTIFSAQISVCLRLCQCYPLHHWGLVPIAGNYCMQSLFWTKQGVSPP